MVMTLSVQRLAREPMSMGRHFFLSVCTAVTVQLETAAWASESRVRVRRVSQDPPPQAGLRVYFGHGVPGTCPAAAWASESAPARLLSEAPALAPRWTLPGRPGRPRASGSFESSQWRQFLGPGPGPAGIDADQRRSRKLLKCSA